MFWMLCIEYREITIEYMFFNYFRLLQNTCKLSQQEIDEKINLDETKCCPRKSRRRKRRRLGSMSEDDEDATYRPHYVPVNPLKRKKRGRRPKYLILDGSTSNVSQSGVSEDSSIDQNELPPSLLSCEQTMVEVENTAINTDSVVTQSQTNSSPPKEPTVVQPNLYNTIVNVVASPNFLSPAPQVMPLRQVPGPLNQMNLYQAMHCGPAPMVTIPNQNAGVLNATHTKKFPSIELRPPPPPPPPLAASTPNVIEIESDSEEGVDVGPSRDSRSFKDHVDNNKAVPVALVSSKNNYSQKKQDTIERCNTKTLNQRLLSYSQEVDSILSCLKVKLQDVFDVWKQEELKKHELHEARNSIKQFHREMRDTVTLLACINDRVVREYNRWKRNQIKSGAVQGLDSDSTCSKVKNEDIPLDMVCVNESDSDVESDLENSVIIPSEFVGSTSIVEGIKNFRKRATVTRAVGNDEPISLVDKFVQIYDVELRDYDKCIRPTAMKVPDQQPERQSDSSTYSNEKKKQPNDYVKEFLNYLQNRVEPENIQKKESKDLPNPNETPLKDLIEANSPFISEMLETMDEPPGISNNINNSQISDNGGNNSNSPAVEEITNSVKSKSVDNFEQMVNNISNTIHSKKTKAQEKDFSTSDDIHVVKVLKNNEQDSSRTKRRSINSSKKRRDGCTIISN
ncbi:uncharacterized protein LOC143177627 isoform X1 [Calliopsis andreniformis]|uniref:uncharacterized protein LOC143177627 isoform X1 n=1 Tax=Calliopsis andreniformis TaxID=337506 RepID=UPI003FCEAE88